MSKPRHADNVYNRNNEIVAVSFTDDSIVVTMCDQRTVSAPLAWFPWLENASSVERENYKIQWTTINWEQFDEGMSIEPFLLGNPATA